MACFKDCVRAVYETGPVKKVVLEREKERKQERKKESKKEKKKESNTEVTQIKSRCSDMKGAL